MSTEGPLSRLMSLLGMADKLKPIPEVKRIEERPFKMTPRPEDMSESGIHRLYGDKWIGEELFRRKPEARAFELSFDYASYRPEGERWIAVDLLTYDGAPDSEAPCNFIGRGASEKEARMDLIEQFRDFDNQEPAPKPRPSRVIHSSQFEPPTYSDRRDEVDFNE